MISTVLQSIYSVYKGNSSDVLIIVKRTGYYLIQPNTY